MVERLFLGVFTLGASVFFGDSIGDPMGEPRESMAAVRPTARLPYCGSTGARAAAGAGSAAATARGASAIGKRALKGTGPPAAPDGLRAAGAAGSCAAMVAPPSRGGSAGMGGATSHTTSIMRCVPLRTRAAVRVGISAPLVRQSPAPPCTNTNRLRRNYNDATHIRPAQNSATSAQDLATCARRRA